MAMEILDFKQCILLISFVWITFGPLNFASGLKYNQNYDPNDRCVKAHGLHERFMMPCCKEKVLVPPPGSKYTFKTVQACKVNVIADNPNDDYATSMWKVEACKMKAIMGLAEADINFQSFVEFQTKNYTTDNDVQKLIREANKECPEGVKETEIHKKIEAYNFCFYKNQQQICNKPTPTGLEVQKNYTVALQTLETPTESKLTCPEIPGIWDQKSYCCKGKAVPNQWKYSSNMLPRAVYGSAKHNLTSACRMDIRKLMTAQTLRKKEAANNTDKKIEKRPLYFMDCYDACTLSPVVIQNDSKSPEVKFNFMETLDTLFEAQTAAIRKELKDITFRHKNDFKITVSEEDYKNKTGMTLDEIENEYGSLEDGVTKTLQYCVYYKHLKELALAALEGYCIAEDAVKNSIETQLSFNDKYNMPSNIYFNSAANKTTQ